MRRLSFFALGLAFLGVGCSFSRTVVNGHVRDMDTSWIEPGRTTKDEIAGRLGRPPSVLGVKDGISRYFGSCLNVLPQGIDVEGEDVDSLEMNAFRWSTLDSFSGMFEGGQWIIPTFSKGRSLRAHDILILFDDKNVVTLVSRTEIADGEVRILEWRELP